MTQVILPDTPSGVLQLMNADKQSLNKFASSIIQDVKEGRENPLEIHLLIKKYEYVLNEIKENIRVNLNTEVSKYGEKPFDYGSAQMHYSPTATSYDFSTCADPEWEQMNLDLLELKERMKARESFLKTLGEPTTLIMKDSGEVVTIYPPIKKSTMGVKVILK